MAETCVAPLHPPPAKQPPPQLTWIMRWLQLGCSGSWKGSDPTSMAYRATPMDHTSTGGPSYCKSSEDWTGVGRQAGWAGHTGQLHSSRHQGRALVLHWYGGKHVGVSLQQAGKLRQPKPAASPRLHLAPAAGAVRPPAASKQAPAARIKTLPINASWATHTQASAEPRPVRTSLPVRTSGAT